MTFGRVRLRRRLALGVVPFILSLAVPPPSGAQDAKANGEREEAGATFLIDGDVTAPAGVRTLFAMRDLIRTLEDRWIPLGPGAGSGLLRRIGGSAWRLARLGLLEAPLEVLHLGLRHEWVGHGGRIRQMGGDVLDYRLELPPPYGGGGGAVLFELEDADPAGRALVSAGGLEAANLDHRLLEERWVRRGRMDSREGLQYLMGALEILGYVAHARGGVPREGHDVESYLAEVNTLAPPGAGPLTPSDLDGVLLTEYLLSPQFFWSLHGVFWSFLVQGDRTAPVPAWDVFGARLMPRAHLRFAPYGPEYAVGILLARGARSATLDVGLGEGPLGSSTSLSVAAHGLAASEAVRLSVSSSLWRQPRTTSAAPSSPRWGGMAMVRGEVDAGIPGLGIVAEAGAKSAGYVPGERLDGGLVFRFGAVFPADLGFD